MLTPQHEANALLKSRELQARADAAREHIRGARAASDQQKVTIERLYDSLKAIEAQAATHASTDEARKGLADRSAAIRQKLEIFEAALEADRVRMVELELEAAAWIRAANCAEQACRRLAGESSSRGVSL